MQVYPTITILTCLFNPDLKIWKKTLEALSHQDYPKGKIEHIILDGGSTNGCIKIAKEYKNNLIVRKDLRNNALQRMKLGIEKSSGEILLFLESDNIIIGNKWLKQMVEPYDFFPEVVGTFSMHNTFNKSMPLLTKYTALIGVNDPLVYYLGKSEKMPLFEKEYTNGKVLLKKRNFTIVEFNASNFPTLGDNGHMIRAAALKKVIKLKKEYYHTDAFFSLLKNGENKYGIVKNKIIHYTGGDLNNFFSKRVLYKKNNYDNNKSRSYLVFNPSSTKDVFKLTLFIIFALTFVQPFLFSIKGYIYFRQKAWFLHPIACFLSLVYYSKSQIAYVIEHRRFV